MEIPRQGEKRMETKEVLAITRELKRPFDVS